eukprot:365602-Chlamydomonas_euryale.AAC.8
MSRALRTICAGRVNSFCSDTRPQTASHRQKRSARDSSAISPRARVCTGCGFTHVGHKAQHA